METLIVVLIIGILAVVSIPFLAKIGRRQRLVASAHEIQQSLLAARMRAVRANQNTSLVITAATGADQDHHLDIVAPDNSPAPTPTPVVYGVLQRNAVDFVTTPTNSKVTFSGQGRMISETVPTPAVITVQSPVGAPPNQVTIRANSAGKIEVVTPVVWQ